LVLIVASFVGCGSSDNVKDPAPGKEVTPPAGDTDDNGDDTEDVTPTLDTSKKIELVSWFAGDGPAGLDDILGPLNEKISEDLNATLKVNYLGWADYQTRYSLLLNAQEECDLLYSANWLNARDYYRKGAFLDLNDYLTDYAPELYAFLDRWEDVSISGNIYAIPNNAVRHNSGGITYREDLRKKHDLPLPDSIENIEAYFEGIKQNEPTIIPTSDRAVMDAMFDASRFTWGKYDTIGAKFGANATGYDESKLAEVTYDWETSEFLEMLKLMKSWADKGFWSRSLLSAQNDSAEDFEAGKTAAIVSGQHTDKWSGYVTRHEEEGTEGWEVEFIPYYNKYGISLLTSAEQDMTVIPIQSKDPARAVALVEKIFMDKEYFQLIQYGIEGEHYVVNEEGQYEPGPKQEEYGVGGMGSWGWRNIDFYLDNPSVPAKVTAMHEIMDTFAPVSPSPFSMDNSSVEAEAASLQTAIEQYLNPLKFGQHDNPEKGLEEFMKQAKIAGYDKVKEEFESQWDVFLGEMGLK
ncbi:MAG TPA: extracellular solute-binding protein, partial [Clostridia bacterium]|nr:extracellular solute-binding protein [Clostridia bacterium]